MSPQCCRYFQPKDRESPLPDTKDGEVSAFRRKCQVASHKNRHSAFYESRDSAAAQGGEQEQFKTDATGRGASEFSKQNARTCGPFRMRHVWLVRLRTNTSAMCGRYMLRKKLNVLLQQFAADLAEEFDYRPRYNIAPTQ